MTHLELIKAINEEEERVKRHAADILQRARMNGSPGFADRMEKYMLEHDMLPLGRKAN